MRFNPATENQARTIDQLAAETRAVISRLPKPVPLARVWCSLKGCWVISQNTRAWAEACSNDWELIA